MESASLFQSIWSSSSPQPPRWTRRAHLLAGTALAGTALGGTLAGCAAGSGSQGAARQPIKLVFLRQVSADDTQLWENAVQRYRANAPAHVTLDYAPDASTQQQYWDKVLAMLSGGAQLDVVDQHSTRIVPWSAANLVLDLTGVMRKNPPPKDVYTASNKLFSYKGKQYGVAWDIAMQGLYYNRTILDGAGVKPPDETWSWDTYLQAARQATRGEGENKVYGSVLLPTALQFLTSWMASNGGRLFDDTQTRCLVTETPAVDTLQWIADLRVKYRVAPTPDEEKVGDLYNLGRAALKVAGNFTALAPIRASQTNGWSIGVAPIPKGSVRRAGFLGGSSHAVTKASRAPDEAWGLARFMSLDDARIKEFGSLGRTMSPRQSLEAYSLPQGIDPAAFKKAFVDTLETAAVGAPFTPNWPDIDKVVSTELAPVWTGQKTAREAAAAIKPQVETLLSQLPKSGPEWTCRRREPRRCRRIS